MSEPVDVEGLLAAVARHDARAFKTLYDHTSGRLMAIVMRICRDRQAAEDVLQEVYVQIWRQSERFDATLGAGLAWMTVLARRRAIDHIRRLGRSDRVATETELELFERLPALSADPELSSELRALLVCLERIDPRHREAVLLAYYEGWSREELARRFDCPVGTIKTWLRRGLVTLRHCMDGG